jgi:hypothetical protein
VGIAEKSSGPASIKLLNIMEHRMTSKYLSRLLILVFGLALAKPAQAQDGPIGPSAGPIIAAIVVTAAAVVIVTVVVIHESTKKRTITGCVNSGANGMTLTNEKDTQIYALSGDTTGIKAGDRIKLQGKKVKAKGPDKALVWKATKVTKDFGVCQP